MVDEKTFPEGFEDLERLAEWALPTEIERHERRLSSTIEELQDIYDAVLARIDEMLAYLNKTPLNELPPPDQRLLNLALSLAEVAPAIEFYGQPEVVDGFDSNRLKIGI